MTNGFELRELGERERWKGGVTPKRGGRVAEQRKICTISAGLQTGSPAEIRRGSYEAEAWTTPNTENCMESLSV
jgi:hypothetical protein